MKRLFLVAIVFSAIGLSQTFSQDVPVDISTGTPVIQVPLWNVTDYDLSTPVSLVYNANGVKLQEDDGWYGLGWFLSAGGNIVRQVRSLPDDYPGVTYLGKGWLYTSASGTGVATQVGAYTLSSDATSSTCIDEQADQAKIAAWHTELLDTEADIFYYNFGGQSGSFVFDNSSTPTIRFIPYRDFKVSYTTLTSSNKTIISFAITTNNGVIYTFGQAVSATRKITAGPQSVSYLWRDYELYKDVKTFNKEWKLTKIESPSGAIINFNYLQLSTVPASKRDINLGIYYSNLTSQKTVKAYTIEENYTRYWLSSIQASSGQKVEFQRLSNETLDKVKISDSRRGTGNEYVKDFLLDYKNVGSATGGSRKFLKKITEASACDKLPPYEFDYIDIDKSATSLPATTSNQKDFWGYSSGRVGGPPKVYIYPNEPLNERYRLYPIPNYSGLQIVLDGADRTTNESFLKAGTLNRVKYPLGGAIVYQYEANTYFDSRTELSYPCGGLRVKSVTIHDGMNSPGKISTLFQYTDPTTSQSSGKLIRRPVFAMPAWKYRDPTAIDNTSFDQLYTSLAATKTTEQLWKYLTISSESDLSDLDGGNESIVSYQFVTAIRPGSGSVRYEYRIPGVYGDGTVGQWTPTDNKFARSSACPTMGLVSTGGAWSFPYIPNPYFNHERGLISKKSEFNETGTLVRLTENLYQELYKSGTQPVKVWSIGYDKYPNSNDAIYFTGKYFHPTEYDQVLSKTTITTYDATATSKNIKETLEYFYDSPNHRLLSVVKKTSGDGTVLRTTYKYPLDFGTIQANSLDALLRIKDLQDITKFRHGIVIEEVNYSQLPGETEKVVHAQLRKFSNFSTNGKILLHQLLTFNPVTPVTDFQSVTTQLDGSNYILKPDTRYDTLSTMLGYDAFDVPYSIIDQSRNALTTVSGFSTTVPVAVVSNAKRGEFAFSDFETTTNDQFSLTNAYYSAARTGLNGVHPYATLQKTITKQGDRYNLSFWFKGTAAVNFRILVKSTNLATTYYDNTFTVAASASGFSFVNRVIPVSNAPTSFVVQLLGQGLTQPSASSSTLLPSVDDVLFSPEQAEATSYTYDLPHGVATTSTSNGLTRSSVYDKLGRLVYTFDQDNNIRSRNTYTYNQTLHSLVASFTTPLQIYRNEAATFTAADNNCISGVTYEWDFGSGTFTAGSVSTNYTFTSAGSFTVRLRVSHPTLGQITSSKSILVTLKPIPVSLCVNGAVSYNCGDEVSHVTQCSSSPYPSQGTIFYTQIGESISGLSYQWMMKFMSSSTWYTMSTGSDQYVMEHVGANSESFQIKCVVTSSDGRTGSELFLIDSVPCN